MYNKDLTALKYKQLCYFTHNFSSPAGKKLLMFIDDMNMPQVDLYGTQQPIALLKLLLEKGGMYDRGKDLNWKLFKDIVLVAAMGKVGTEYDINLTLACGGMTMSIDCARLMYENSGSLVKGLYWIADPCSMLCCNHMRSQNVY